MTVSAARSPVINPAPGRATAWAGLRLHHVRYVLAAAECGGFRRAARRLGVQQSAVSRRIQDLEDRLGARLFERGPSGVLLTAVGREFVEGAHGAMVELDRAVDQVADLARGDQATLRIGILAPLGPGPLDDLLRRLLAAVPDLTLEMSEGRHGSGEWRDKLQSFRSSGQRHRHIEYDGAGDPNQRVQP